MNHDQAQDLLADFALSLLDREEAAELAAHLETCAECRSDLELFSQASDALAFATEDVALPAGARDRIRAGVRSQLHPGSPPGDRLPSKLIAGPWRMAALATAAAVLVLAVGLTAVTIAWLGARDDVDRLEGQLAARAIELPLRGDGASGTIYVAANFEGGVASLSGLPAAPAQHHYQIWSEGPQGPVPAADFAGSEGELLVELPALPKEMTRMFVTIEPDGVTASAPTGPEVLSTPG